MCVFDRGIGRRIVFKIEKNKTKIKKNIQPRKIQSLLDTGAVLL